MRVLKFCVDEQKIQKCPDAILTISQEVAQITSRCIYPYPMVGADAQWSLSSMIC